MGDDLKERTEAILKAFQATKHFKEDNIPCRIEEGLYLGSLAAANMRDNLKSVNVTHILTVTCSHAPSYPNDFSYKIIEVHDRSDVKLSLYFEECFAFIDEAKARGGGVLVHCFAGISRSVTVVVAYLMYKNGMSLSEAMEFVKLKRPVANPNCGFMLQLQEYERSLQGNKSKGGHEPAEKCGSSL